MFTTIHLFGGSLASLLFFYRINFSSPTSISTTLVPVISITTSVGNVEQASHCIAPTNTYIQVRQTTLLELVLVGTMADVDKLTPDDARAERQTLKIRGNTW